MTSVAILFFIAGVLAGLTVGWIKLNFLTIRKLPTSDIKKFINVLQAELERRK